MSDAKACTRGCGTLVYFDKNSPTGHPSPDKWIPLEIKEGRKTDVAHNCPKRHGGSDTLDNTNTATTPAIVVKPELLKLAESLSEILQEYVKLKRQA